MSRHTPRELAQGLGAWPGLRRVGPVALQPEVPGAEGGGREAAPWVAQNMSDWGGRDRESAATSQQAGPGHWERRSLGPICRGRPRPRRLQAGSRGPWEGSSPARPCPPAGCGRQNRAGKKVHRSMEVPTAGQRDCGSGRGNRRTCDKARTKEDRVKGQAAIWWGGGGARGGQAGGQVGAELLGRVWLLAPWAELVRRGQAEAWV